MVTAPVLGVPSLPFATATLARIARLLQTLKLTHKLLLCSSLLDINYVKAVSYNMNTPEASRQQGGTEDRATALRDPSTPRQAAGP